MALAAGGLIAIVSHPFLFPALLKRFKLRSLYCALATIFPLCYLMLPCLNVVARRMTKPENEDVLTAQGRIVIWVMLGIVLFTIRMGGMAYACISSDEGETRVLALTVSSANTIFVKNAAPSSEALGSTFGIAQTLGSTARGVAAAFGVLNLLAVFNVRDGVGERERGISRR